MATEQPDAPTEGSGGAMFGKQILLLALVLIAGLVIYKTFFSNGGLSGLFGGGPKDVQLTYVPSDFQPNLDEESTLRILANPEKNRKEFDALVYNFNLSLLYHVANRMGMPDSLKRQLEPMYRIQHEYLATMYFNDFVALKDTTASLYETFYSDNSNQAVQIFNEVAGKYTCFFVTQIMATLLKVNNGRFTARGKDVGTPCDIAINEALRPLVDRLQKKAAIYDFSASRGLLKEKVRQGIAELGTYELRSRLAIDKTLSYKIFGFSVSETDIQIEAISVVKAGFKLDQFFDVTFSPSKGIVYVKLPQPTILSHEVYPRVDKLDVGFLAGISGEEMNRNFNELRRQFRDDAINNEHVLDHAKARADTVMQLMLGPVVKSMGRNYKLEVRFEGTPSPDAMEAQRQGTAPIDKPQQLNIQPANTSGQRKLPQ